MKELSIEEKARRYDEAIEIAKDINNEQRAQPFNVMTRVFPELAESEDDKIRKELLNYLYDVHDDDEDRARWIAWLKKQAEQKQEWSEEDEAVLDALIRRLEGEDIHVSPHLAVKCLKSLKGRVQPQPRQEWSEEDESHIRYLIECLEHCKKGVALTMTASTAQEYINWLKSLRPQSQWKPSDEQMSALSKAIAFVFDSNSDVKHSLESLYNELKKL